MGRRVSRFIIVFGCLSLVLFFGVDRLSRYDVPLLLGEAHWTVEPPGIALTFDDGPDPRNTPQLLDVLERHGVRATFFVTGQHATKHPELVREIARRGHRIGNHSWSHPRMILRSPGFVRQQIDDTDAAIRRAGYTGDIPFRAPHGRKLIVLPWVLDRAKRTHVLFDVTPADYLVPPVDDIVAEVLDRVKPGSIILLHDGGGPRGNSVEAADRLIPLLRQRGLRFVDVPG